MDVHQMKSPKSKSARSHYLCLLICSVYTARDLGIGICRAAQAGRLLPRLTLALALHAVAHWLSAPSCDNWAGRCSLYIMASNLGLCAVGHLFIVLLYRHSVHTIFNRKIPTISKDDEGCYRPVPHPAVPSFILHLSMLRPLEVIFRFLTSPLRVLPDVIILGETRCGTTNLCGHMCSLSGGERMRVKCYTPFCAWDHPELDHKESFYFVGHYLGIVDPMFYRMAFPLKLTRWWEEKVRGNVFFCFDGCAQYLTSPSAPYLIACAYRGKEPPPVLVACIRHPVDQATSWWRFENNFVTLGDEIGLKEWNTELRSMHYPPKSISDALQFSESEFVQSAYATAEKLVENVIHSHGEAAVAGKLLQILRGDVLRLPPWAITWPAGQLSTIGRSGKYGEHIERYNNVFEKAFGVTELKGRNGEHPTKSSKTPEEKTLPNRASLVHLVPIECQSAGDSLKREMRPFLKEAVVRSAQRRKLPSANLVSILDGALDQLTGDRFRPTRRNSSTLINLEVEPSKEDLDTLEGYFAKEIEWYTKVAS